VFTNVISPKDAVWLSWKRNHWEKVNVAVAAYMTTQVRFKVGVFVRVGRVCEVLRYKLSGVHS